MNGVKVAELLEDNGLNQNAAKLGQMFDIQTATNISRTQRSWLGMKDWLAGMGSATASYSVC